MFDTKQVRRYCLSLTRNADQAEDLLQDVSMEWWKHSSESGNFYSLKWLKQRAFWLFLNGLEKRSGKSFEAKLPSRSQESPFESLLKKELREAVRREVQNLPPRYRRVIILGCLDGLSNADIAKELGVREQRIRTQKSRGLDMLRMRLVESSLR